MSATLHIVGVGPGDPELLTIKAARILGATRLIAHFAKHGQPGHARRVAAGCLRADAEELRFEYPVTTELSPHDPCYRGHIERFYAAAARTLADRLAVEDVALLCEGDPFFYGSAMYVFDRLSPAHDVQVVPGVTGMSGAWTAARLPMTQGDDVMAVLPGTLGREALAARLAGSDAAVVMKVGRNLAKIRAALAGRPAVYVERAAMPEQRIMDLNDVPDGSAPYFSLVLVPGRRGMR